MTSDNIRLFSIVPLWH